LGIREDLIQYDPELKLNGVFKFCASQYPDGAGLAAADPGYVVAFTVNDVNTRHAPLERIKVNVCVSKLLEPAVGKLLPLYNRVCATPSI
jgi:hypothetical protein